MAEKNEAETANYRAVPQSPGGVEVPSREAPTALPGAREGDSDAWPPIPDWMANPLVFRDANLGIVLVAGPDGDQMIYKIHGRPHAHLTPESSRLSGWMWVSVRKVDERDGFQLVDALNLPKPISLPPVTVEPIHDVKSSLHSAPVGSVDDNASLPDWPGIAKRLFSPPVVTELTREEAEAVMFLATLKTWLDHSVSTKAEHTMVPNWAMERIIAALDARKEKLHANHDAVQDAAAGER